MRKMLLGTYFITPFYLNFDVKACFFIQFIINTECQIYLSRLNLIFLTMGIFTSAFIDTYKLSSLLVAMLKPCG